MRAATSYRAFTSCLVLLHAGHFLVDASEPDQTALLQTNVKVWPADKDQDWPADEDSKQAILDEPRALADSRESPELVDASRPSATDPQLSEDAAEDIGNLLESLNSIQGGLDSAEKHAAESFPKHQSTAAFAPEDAKQSQEKLQSQSNSTESESLSVGSKGRAAINTEQSAHAASGLEKESTHSLHRLQSFNENEIAQARSERTGSPQEFASSNAYFEATTSKGNHSQVGVKAALELEEQNMLAQQAEFSKALERVDNRLHVIEADEAKRFNDDVLLTKSLGQGVHDVEASEQAVGIQLELEKKITKFLTDAVKQAEDSELIQQNVASREDQASLYLEIALKEVQAALASAGGKTSQAIEKALKDVLRAQAQVVAGAGQQKEAAFTLNAALRSAASAATARQSLSQTQILRSLQNVEDKMNHLQSMTVMHQKADTKATNDMKDAEQEMERAGVASQGVLHSLEDVKAAQSQQELALEAAQHALTQKESKVMAKAMEVAHKAHEVSQKASEARQTLYEERRKVRKQLEEEQRQSQAQADQILLQATEERRQVDAALRQAEEERKRAIMQADEEKARAVDNFKSEAFKIAEERREADENLRHAADAKRQADHLIQAAKSKQMQVEMQIRNSVQGLTHASRQVADTLQSGLTHRSRRVAERPDPLPFGDGRHKLDALGEAERPDPLPFGDFESWEG